MATRGFAVGVGILLGLVWLPAGAVTTIRGCLTIERAGSYVLLFNLPSGSGLRADGSCIEIRVNNVTLDLNGYVIRGNGLGDPVLGAGILLNAQRNVTIMNGTVKSFPGDGIADVDLAGDRMSQGHTIINVRVLDNSRSGIQLRGRGHRVENCQAQRNLRSGISVGNGATLIGNKAFANRTAGILASKNSLIRNNTANQNGEGISAGERSAIEGNTALENDGYGISASTSLLNGNIALDNALGGLNCDSCTLGTNLTD